MPEHKDLAEHFVSGELVYDGTLLKARRDVVAKKLREPRLDQ